MKISALTCSVVKRNHAVISPDGYINSRVPGWDDCTVNVIINEQMGANLCQTIITLTKSGQLTGITSASQLFFYVIDGQCTATVNGDKKTLTTGQFVYIPVGSDYRIDHPDAGTQLLTFHKVYEKLPGYDVPPVLFGDAADVAGPAYLGDPALRLQVLLPDELRFDMAVNIFTYDPGGHLPLVETHIMEHGLLYLQGQGVYRLDQDWYPIKKGDAIWMAPYCQQWFTAMGERTGGVYLLQKHQPFPNRCVMTLSELNQLPVLSLKATLTTCCGASAWVNAMASRFPAGSEDVLFEQADSIWLTCSETDWREAFMHHPKIGDIDSLRAKFAPAKAWAAGEQAGVSAAPQQVLEDLAEGNRRYEARFGYIFIICATGKSAGEMLDSLTDRLANPPEAEIRIAMQEQQKITRIRLEKLLA